MPFQATTQARFWMFSDVKLAALRRTGAELAVKKLQSAGPGTSEAAPLQPEEERMLRYFYETKIQEVCREENKQDPTRFTDRVMFAALMYFKRYFLRVSLMEVDPKHVMLAALLVAGKVEEERVEPDDLLRKYSPKLKLEALLALELRMLEALSFHPIPTPNPNPEPNPTPEPEPNPYPNPNPNPTQALSFQLVTVSPFRALQGFLQDLQSEVSKESDLEQLHILACDFIRRSLCDDAPFLFTPQQLALAGLAEAGSHPSLPTGGVDVAGWLAKRFQFLGQSDAKGGEGGVALLLAQLEAVRANVSAAADASRQATEGLMGVDARGKQIRKAIKAAAAKPQGEADAKVKGGPGGRSAAGAAGGGTAAGAAEAALQTKRRKHDPDALFAAGPGAAVKPEPA